MSLKKPALDPMSLTPRVSSGYPEPYRSRVLPREKRALGDPLGLTKIGINHTTLPPGKESSMRHWHTHEDEFVFVLSGVLIFHTDHYAPLTLNVGDSCYIDSTMRPVSYTHLTLPTNREV